MSEEHDPININQYILPTGRWSIQYYEENSEIPKFIDKIYDIKSGTLLKDLIIDGYKIASCRKIST